MTSNDAPAQARSLLFVPGNRAERFDKALRSGADAVILDLEDAVPLAEKASAREAVGQQWPRLLALDVPLVVRINAADSAAWAADLAVLAGLQRLAAVMVPKAESADALRQAHEALSGVALLPLVESAAGYDALSRIAAAQGVLRLALGHIDFMADTGLQCSDDERELAPLRFAIVMATRLQRLAPAIDGVTVSIDDVQRLREDTQRARASASASAPSCASIHARWPGCTRRWHRAPRN